MSMLQTLVRFLSLKSRPEDFPEAKVSGDVTRTLAILNGLSNGGVRTVQVDEAGQLFNRDFDATDIDEVQAASFNVKTYIDITGKVKDVLLWTGRVVNSTYIMSVLSRGDGETDFYGVPNGLGGYYIDPNYYINFVGITWGKFTRFKFIASDSISGYYAAYTLKEK